MSATRISCKLFVTDMDGTILVDGGPEGAKMPQRTLEALRSLSSRGVTICLASGRMHESIRQLSNSWGLKGPVISYNGAMVRFADDSLLAHHPLEPLVSDAVVEAAETRGLPLNFYFDGMVLSRRFQPWWDLYEGRTCSPMKEVESLRLYRGKAPTKLLIMSEPARIRELEAEFKPRFQGIANVLVTADEYLEFMAPHVNKGAALADLASRLGIALQDVAAAGDGFNDLEMLEAAGCAVAVSGAREAVKAVADHVVAGPEACGVANFIEEHLL